MESAMAQRRTALNVGIVCTALTLITLSSSFGGEPANSMDQSSLANGRLAQASGCDVVTCSYVTKTVICHRIAHSCPPQLLLPFRSLPQKQTTALRPFPDLTRCRHFRSYRLQSGRSVRVCARSK
jgi:hypothetical protein